MVKKPVPSFSPEELLQDVRQMIEQGRKSIASTVNAGLTMLYWQIGNRIYNEILENERAEYGKTIVVTLSRQLTAEYGNGFFDKNLRRMIQFAETFSNDGM
jgi:hypothetical protein